MSEKKKLAKNTIIIFLGKISTQFISFFLIPVYTKYLQTDDYGTIDLYLTYVTLLIPIISLQLETAVFRFLIDCRDNEIEINKIITTSFYILIKLIIAFIVIYRIILFFSLLKALDLHNFQNHVLTKDLYHIYYNQLNYHKHL